MTNDQRLSEIKERIATTIRRNSDRGFIPYSGCNRICAEMSAILEETERCPEEKLAFDIFMVVLLRMMKLISHADTSSGAATDVIRFCLEDIEKLCQTAAEAQQKYFFDSIIKAARNKAFQDWPDQGYELLKSAVHFVRDNKQAQKIKDIFPLLGTLYDGKPYPDELLITLAIIERLDGAEAADQYMMAHIDVPEMRMLAVDKAFAARHYLRVEKLCREAIKENVRGDFNRRPPWAYYLERLYAEINQQEKLHDTIRFILFQRDTSYFPKLKEIYVRQGVWEERRESLWQELSQTLASHEYASLLAQEGELEKLLDIVKRHPTFVFHYGKQLAGRFAAETYAIYEACIVEEAQEATDRGKYRQVCRMLKDYAAAGAKEKAIDLIGRLVAKYPRRPAMLEELAGLRKRLGK
ncbi:MAG: hypothetical protein AB9917_24135 [Negativicutes bacterium]